MNGELTWKVAQNLVGYDVKSDFNQGYDSPMFCPNQPVNLVCCKFDVWCL